MMDINGIPVEAYYHDEDVERIFQPLLEMLGRMQKADLTLEVLKDGRFEKLTTNQMKE